MGFFGFLFWLVVIWCAFRIWRRWQWERLATAAPRGSGPVSGWYDSSEFLQSADAGDLFPPIPLREQRYRMSPRLHRHEASIMSRQSTSRRR